MSTDHANLRLEIEELVPDFGNNAYLLYAMGLRLGTLDYDGLRTECLLDGPDDKKIDFFHLDFDDGIATIAQGYYTANWELPEPPANKAADLNCALAWLLESDVTAIPRDSIRAAAEQLRDALQNREVVRLEVFYVHNLPHSANVDKELETVQRSAQRLLESHKYGAPSAPECVAAQVDRDEVNKWRATTHETISIHEKIELTSLFPPQEVQSTQWKAAVAAVPADQLVGLRARYGESLFSANVRDYLGSRQTARNINLQIERTAIEQPQNFLVYNNGITVLTQGIHIKDRVLVLDGIAVINGAQTTGSLAQAVARGKISEAAVLVRAIKCNDPALVDEIIRYNNTQNPIKAWELRVIDPIQRRLREQFEEFGLVYQLRRGGGRRRADDISYEHLGPFLSAFYGDPIAAHKSRAELFESEAKYRKLFDERSDIRNLAFIYRLGCAVGRVKRRLKLRIDSGTASEEELSKYEYFRYGAFAFVLIHVCAEIVGLLLNARDEGFRKRVRVPDELLKDTERCEELLAELCEVALGPVHLYLQTKDAYKILKLQSGVEDLSKHARTIVDQVRRMKPDTYSKFTDVLLAD